MQPAQEQQPVQKQTALPEARSLILEQIKRTGKSTLVELAEALSNTKEAVRQHLVKLEHDGWVQRVAQNTGSPGRPHYTYQLTTAGDHLFLKNYDTLALQLIETLVNKMGAEGLRTLLTELTDKQVARWETRLQGKSLAERIEALKGIYFEEDPFTSVAYDAEGPVLIEQNCPYYNVAMEHPAMCSITVSTLTRLLGVKVRREEQFQAGDKRCVFRVLQHHAIDTNTFQFEFEEESV